MHVCTHMCSTCVHACTHGLELAQYTLLVIIHPLLSTHTVLSIL